MSDTPPSLNRLAADPLVSAALRLRPETDVVDAVILSGIAWRISFCSPGCRCAESRAAEESFPEDLSRLGLRARASSKSDGSDGSDRSDLEGVRKSQAPRGRALHRDLDLLLEFGVWSLRPAVADWCETRGGCTPVGWGLSAYDCRLNVGADVPTPMARQLSELREAAAAWLTRRAGRQRTPYAVRLRRAGEWFRRESVLLADLTGRDDLLRARDASENAVEALTEAALIQAGISPPLRNTLLAPPEEPLSGTEQQEAIYLARAGRRALRVLAARRLAGGEGGQVSATLQQLLWEPYAPLSDTALWAVHPDIRPRMALGVVRGMLQDEPAALRASLLCAVSSEETPELHDLIAALAEGEMWPGLRREVRAWLRAAYPDLAPADSEDKGREI